jgi:hypothetical protein
MVMVMVVVIPHTTVHKGENTIAAPNPRKMSTFERGMLRHMQGKTTYAIAREEEPP